MRPGGDGGTFRLGERSDQRALASWHRVLRAARGFLMGLHRFGTRHNRQVRVRFDSTEKEFVRDDDTRLGIGRRFNAVVVPNELLCDLNLESLNDAVAAALSKEQDSRFGLWWPSDHDQDHQEKWPRGIRDDVHF